MFIATIHAKGARKKTIEKVIQQALAEKYTDAVISVEKRKRAESRAERFADVLGLVSEAKSEAEGLRDELQSWLDNLPENMQSGSKADELNEAISSLEELVSSLEDAECAEVSFPSMM